MFEKFQTNHGFYILEHGRIKLVDYSRSKKRFDGPFLEAMKSFDKIDVKNSKISFILRF